MFDFARGALSSSHGWKRMAVSVLILVASALVTGAPARGSPDQDGNGFVDTRDHFPLTLCLNGPQQPGTIECFSSVDVDNDQDVDLADFSLFQNARGHLPIPLRDTQGNILQPNSTVPYSGRQTCAGECHAHDVDHISNGSWFQDGRTNSSGLIDMRNDYDGDGRYWVKSAGRYGRWGQSFQFIVASKDNTHASQIDQTTFAWVRDCSGCHPGGGPGELDRDGELFFDAATGEFGYEKLGLNSSDVALDGDYSLLNYSTGSTSLAPWNTTGLSEPDCLLCHRNDRPMVGGVDMTHSRRRSVLAAGSALRDNNSNPVPAFASAATAGQGWFSTLVTGSDPRLQIDYNVGMQNGSLCTDNDSLLQLAPHSVTWPPKDVACWGCHPFPTITGTTWFDERDVHYRKFTNRHDADPANDTLAADARVCTVCHRGTVDHNVGKGNSPQLHYRDDLDWGPNMRTCRNCHLQTLPNGDPNPYKHPDAPNVPGETLIHNVEMYNLLSCQFCHIPYSLLSSLLFRDITIPGVAGASTPGMSSQYYSADPLNPAGSDKSKWYPSFVKKADVDGVFRWFPANYWIIIYFGDWNQNGTPGDYSDDIIAPIYTWRVAQAVGGAPLPVVSDDNGDTRLEINRPSEILAYIQALKGNDANGQPIALHPVLVKGKQVWYEDPLAPEGVSSFDHTATDIPMEWHPYIWGMDHNVLQKEMSLGYDPIVSVGCTQCHRPLTMDSPVIDRKILVDPYGPDGNPVYETIRAITGLNPP